LSFSGLIWQIFFYSNFNISPTSPLFYSTVFHSDHYDNELPKDVKNILEAIIEDESLPKSSSRQINPYLFKTPLDLVFTRGEPERKFVEALCKKDNAKKIRSWIKSRDQGFYSVEYSITTTGGKHSKPQSFNPDFFINIVINDFEYIIVVEIKSDDDLSPENKAKFKYSIQHFDDLNELLKKSGIKQKYVFHFLSPNNYIEFFQYLRDDRLIEGKFRSELEGKLKNGNSS